MMISRYLLFVTFVIFVKFVKLMTLVEFVTRFKGDRRYMYCHDCKVMYATWPKNRPRYLEPLYATVMPRNARNLVSKYDSISPAMHR